MFPHPHGAGILRPAVPGHLMRRALLPHVPDPKLLVSACSHEEIAIRAPGEGLHDVAVLERQARFGGLDVPDLDGVVARRRGEDVGCGGGEEDLSYFAAVAREFGYGCYVGGLVGVGVQGEVGGDAPDEDFAVVGAGGDDVVVEGVPVVWVRLD
jgi:hypothetical protein